jgi:membrane-associated phospholipid phosphatase
MVRRRLRLSAVTVIGAGALAPVAAYAVMPPGRRRQVAVCVLSMWVYTAAYKMPHDDERRQAERVRIDYPIAIDRLLGLGITPSLRLQRAFAKPGAVNRFERVLVWCHWTWFFVPHSSVLFVLLREPDRFVGAAARMYAVFDVGAVFYWVLPTAPPWWAAAHGHHEEGEAIRVRRMMIEYGTQFWGRRWGALYDVLGGNPLAAMPSLHFATSLMAAHVLDEVGPLPGLIGWSYAALLGLALVYLGEHYVIDLIAGAALAEAVQLGAPRATRLADRKLRALRALGAGTSPSEG